MANLSIDLYVLYAYIHMKSEFDPRKDAENLAKHGVALADGDGVLLDPMALTIEDGTSVGERRWVTIGVNVFGALLVVVWTERDAGIRLISVRRAATMERKSYEKGI
jgi:uncharacterized protein